MRGLRTKSTAYNGSPTTVVSYKAPTQQSALSCSQICMHLLKSVSLPAGGACWCCGRSKDVEVGRINSVTCCPEPKKRGSVWCGAARAPFPLLLVVVQLRCVSFCLFHQQQQQHERTTVKRFLFPLVFRITILVESWRNREIKEQLPIRRQQHQISIFSDLPDLVFVITFVLDDSS